ncbi:MAG TPA: ATP-grasp domain-containing protein [Gaiellaceae bacterium]|nr:ATP-grasp domain-containing protein [Gaiellaceae bacterium]
MEGGATPGDKRLLVLGAGPAQLGLLEAAHDRGLHVIAVDRDPLAPGFRFADRRAIVSVEDEPAIDRLAGAERVDGIVAPGIDFPVAIAARVAGRLGLPHPIDPPTAQAATSKLRQRERFAEASVPHARHIVCSSLAEATAAAAELGFPCVVKAPDLQGQKGLALVQSEDGLEEAFDQARGLARSSVVMVEELVDGPEITVNAFSVEGRFHPLTVTDRVVAEPPAFGVALAHVWPSELRSETVEAAVRLAKQAAEAIGVRDGPTYTQVLIGADGPRVGELAARLGGGHDAELCDAAVGVDLNRLAIAAALGERIYEGGLVPDELAGGACVRFLVPEPGVLESVDGLEAAEKSGGIVWVRSYRQAGHEFEALRRGGDRAGAVLAVGDSRKQAVERADKAAARIRFVTADAEALV